MVHWGPKGGNYGQFFVAFLLRLLESLCDVMRVELVYLHVEILHLKLVAIYIACINFSHGPLGAKRGKLRPILFEVLLRPLMRLWDVMLCYAMLC